MPASQRARRKARTGIPYTNPIERLNKGVKRRADVVGTFSNEAAIIRLVGAVLLVVDHDFTASGPDQLWVADITYGPTATKFLHPLLRVCGQGHEGEHPTRSISLIVCPFCWRGA